MKTIVITSNVIWSITQFRTSLIRELHKQYNIICVADIDNFSENSLDILEQLKVRFIRIPINRKGVNPFGDLIYFLRLLLLYIKLKPDFVIHYSIKPNIYGSFVTRILKIQSFCVISGLGSSFIKDNLITKIIQFLYKNAFSSVQKVLFLNNDDKEVFLKSSFIQPQQAFVLPGEGVDIDFFTGCSRQTDTHLSFLLIARLLKDKGIYEYIEAIKAIKNKNVMFLLAGAFDEQNPTSIKSSEVQKWVNDGLIKYLGKTDNIKEFYALADVVVLPSYREGLSMVLLEACSCEKFIITSDIAGCKELCQDNFNGFLCQPNDIMSLQKAIEKTIELRKDVIISRGKKGRELVVNRYSVQMVNQIYKKLIGQYI